MANFGPLAAEIVSLVWGAPANFNRFRVLASLLHRRRSTEANQTLHDVWPSPVHIFGDCCPVTEFSEVQNSVCVLRVLRSPIGSVTARQSSSGREPNFAALSTGRHLYSAGRPSRWALAHILVAFFKARVFRRSLQRCTNLFCLLFAVSAPRAMLRFQSAMR